MIFNIQKCSIHDGAGMRTLVFFKGCPLHCSWCANPESQEYGREIMEFSNKCIGCGECVSVCPQGAISYVNNQFKIDRNRCNKCFKCTEVCYAESKKVVGKEMDVEELFQEIWKDRYFYQNSGGGVTFSGGEPLTHPKFLTEILKKCKENRINTAIETCGCGNFESFKEALPYIDYMFFDIKHMDSAVHKALTGGENELILENLKKMQAYNVPITIRTPVIPGLNDTAENIEATATFIKDLPNVKEYELLPYHNLGASKYASLGVEYALNEIKVPEDIEIERLVRQSNQILQPHGKQCFYTAKNKKEVLI